MYVPAVALAVAVKISVRVADAGIDTAGENVHWIEPVAAAEGDVAGVPIAVPVVLAYAKPVGSASVIELTVKALPSVFAIEMVKVTVPPAVTNDGLAVFDIDGAPAPHELITLVVTAPVALGKLAAAPPVNASTDACEANWLQVTLPEPSVAFTASRYWPRVSAAELQVAVQWPTGLAAAVPAAATVHVLPASLATPSAFASA